MKRITLIACFDEKSNKIIEGVINNLNKLLCKVPYNIEDRFNNDTLPYHITLSAWNADKAELIIQKMKNLDFKKINCDYKFNLMDSTIKGNILFLDLINDTSVKLLQKCAYDFLPTERYNPSTYKLHSTINIDENKENNIELFNKLKDLNLSLTIDKICLFEIYPAKLLQTINLF